MRQPILPMAYTPFHRAGANGALQGIVEGTFVVRTTSANPLARASILRKEVTAIRPGFRVSNIRTEQGLIKAQTVRERLLAMWPSSCCGCRVTRGRRPVWRANRQAGNSSRTSGLYPNRDRARRTALVALTPLQPG
jgi:hypothetical protein